MFQDKYVFSHLVVFLDRNNFIYLVRKYRVDRYVESFICWNQLLTMMFGQLSNRVSLRDQIVALDAHKSKCYHHLGGGKKVMKATLVRATPVWDGVMVADIT